MLKSNGVTKGGNFFAVTWHFENNFITKFPLHDSSKLIHQLLNAMTKSSGIKFSK